MIWNASGEMGKKLISVNYKINFYGLKKEVVELLQPLFIMKSKSILIKKNGTPQILFPIFHNYLL